MILSFHTTGKAISVCYTLIFAFISFHLVFIERVSRNPTNCNHPNSIDHGLGHRETLGLFSGVFVLMDCPEIDKSQVFFYWLGKRSSFIYLFQFISVVLVFKTNVFYIENWVKNRVCEFKSESSDIYADTTVKRELI